MAATAYKGLSDSILVQLVAEGDNRACSALVQRYNQMVCNKTDARDLTIQGFTKVFLNMHQYTPEFAFSTWLFTIAKNNCIDFFRGKMIRKKRNTISIDEHHVDAKGREIENELPSNGLSPEEQLIKKQRARLLYKTVSKLDPLYRSIIKLYCFKELSTEEVSERSDIPINRVKVYLFRGRKELYQLYGIT